MAVERIPIVPDGGWGWVVVVGSFFIHVFADGFVYACGVLVEKLMGEFGSDNTTASMVIALLTGLTLGSGPIASALTDKYGCRVTTITGSVIATFGCMASYFATSMHHIIFTVGVCMGFGFGLIYCPAIVIVTMYFEKYRSLATGLAVCGAGVGTMVFSPINAYVINNYGWQAIFVMFTFVVMLCGVCGATFRPLQFIERETGEEEEKEEEDGDKDKMQETELTTEDAALLSPQKTRAFSNMSIDKAGKTSLKGAMSMSSVGPAEAGQAGGHRSRSGTMTDATGYMQRKDVLYTGSITSVAEFKENPDKYRSTSSLHSRKVPGKHLDDVKEVSEEESTGSPTPSRKTGCMSRVVSALSLDLLVNPAYLLFAISNLLTSIGFNSPLYFLPMHAKSLGLTPEQGGLTLSAFGILNTVGRVVFGMISDHPLPLPFGMGKDPVKNRLWLYILSLSLCGVLTGCTFMFDSFISLAAYSGAFGFSIASYICLTSVILVDLVGLDNLTPAFGLLLLFQGIGTVFGPPLAGYFADLTGSYGWSFFFCGVNLLVSGVMLAAIPYIHKKHPPPQSSGKAPVMH